MWLNMGWDEMQMGKNTCKITCESYILSKSVWIMSIFSFLI